MIFCAMGQNGSFFKSLSDIFFLICLWLTFLSDWKDRRIPNFCFVVIMLLSVGKVLLGTCSITFLVVGMLVPGGGFAVLYLLRPKALGWGDVKLTAALGAYLGYQMMFFSIGIGVFLAVCYCLVCVCRDKTVHFLVPLGSFLCLGTFVVWIMK